MILVLFVFFSLLFSAMKSITQKLMQERSTQKYIEHQITKRMFDYFISNFFNFGWDWLFVFRNKTIDYFVLWVSLFKLPPTLFEQRNNKRKKRLFFFLLLYKKNVVNFNRSLSCTLNTEYCSPWSKNHFPFSSSFSGYFDFFVCFSLWWYVCVFICMWIRVRWVVS